MSQENNRKRGMAKIIALQKEPKGGGLYRRLCLTALSENYCPFFKLLPKTSDTSVIVTKAVGSISWTIDVSFEI